jgi:hypothetical protein
MHKKSTRYNGLQLVPVSTSEIPMSSFFKIVVVRESDHDTIKNAP